VATGPQEPFSLFDLLGKPRELGAEVVQVCENTSLRRLENSMLRCSGQHARNVGLSTELGTKGSQAPHLFRFLHTVSLHLRDARAERFGIGVRVQGCSLGRGLVDVPWRLNSVRSNRRGANALIELRMDSADVPAAILKQEEAWIAESLAHARSALAGMPRRTV